MDPKSMQELGKKLFFLKGKKDKLEDDLKKVNADITELATVQLAKVMEDGEIEKFTVKGRGTVYLKPELYVNVLADDRTKLYAWLRANGHKDLVKDWVAPQTLKAFCNEQIEEGKPLPDVVKATFIPTAKTRKG